MHNVTGESDMKAELQRSIEQHQERQKRKQQNQIDSGSGGGKKANRGAEGEIKWKGGPGQPKKIEQEFTAGWRRGG